MNVKINYKRKTKREGKVHRGWGAFIEIDVICKVVTYVYKAVNERYGFIFVW